MPPKSKGRMIRKGISQSKEIASLSIESGYLFCLLIPHFSAHGKMNGSPFFIKGEIVPLMDHYTLKKIEKCLKEISDKTNVKWFWADGIQYLHSLNWKEHQELREGRLGIDYDPSFPGELPELPGVVPPEGKGKGKEEVKGKGPAPLDEKKYSKIISLTRQFILNVQGIHPNLRELQSDKQVDTITRWEHDFRKMHELDNRSFDDIERLMDFIKNDLPDGSWGGWSTNIQSAGTFRKKFDKLLAQSRGSKPQPRNDQERLDIPDF